jgi:hypothetical protein
MKSLLVCACVLLPGLAQAGQIDVLQARYGDLTASDPAVPCDVTQPVRMMCDGKTDCTVPVAPTLCAGRPASDPMAKLSINFDCGGQGSQFNIGSAGSVMTVECGGAASPSPSAGHKVSSRHAPAIKRVSVAKPAPPRRPPAIRLPPRPREAIVLPARPREAIVLPARPPTTSN